MADARDTLEKIEEISKVTATKGTKSPAETETVERLAPNKDHFDALMQRDATQVSQQDSAKVTLMDEIRDLHRKAVNVSKASPDTIVKQAKDTIAQIDEVKDKLSTPNLELPGSVQGLLQNKLTHINESLKIALNRTGSEFAPAAVANAQPKNPIEKFLSYLTHSQWQLQKVSEDINQMALNKTELSPGSVLAIQMKMGYVSQEVEFFTAILNNCLQSIKTVMNVQV